MSTTSPVLAFVPTPRKGSGPVTCSEAHCRGHRDACLFGRQHRWHTWYENGRLMRTEDTYRCVACDGVCVGEEPAPPAPATEDAVRASLTAFMGEVRADELRPGDVLLRFTHSAGVEVRTVHGTPRRSMPYVVVDVARDGRKVGETMYLPEVLVAVALPRPAAPKV